MAAGLLVLAAVVAACSVGAEPDPNRVDPSSVPFGLLEAQTTTTVAEAGETVDVYLLAGGELVTVRRILPDDSDLADLLELVVAGPTDTERRLGLTSAVPQGTIASVDTTRGAAQVDLAPSFGALGSADQLLGLAQIVWVLTGQPGIGSVTFTLDGEPIEVPRTDGTASALPLTRDDFAALAPR